MILKCKGADSEMRILLLEERIMNLGTSASASEASLLPRTRGPGGSPSAYSPQTFKHGDRKGQLLSSLDNLWGDNIVIRLTLWL